MRRETWLLWWLPLAALLVFVGTADLPAQGVTTSSISGQVTDEQGQPLEGVQIVVQHLPTGTQKGVLTRSNGRFVVPGLRPGGPYRVEAQMIGREDRVVDGLSLQLGETEEVDLTLRSEAVEVEEITVTTLREALETSGVATVVDEQAIESAPTIARDFADYVRLTPQAYVENDDDDGPAISIAGQNNRFNTIYVDGAVSNDVFGLSAQGVNGGQTGATPISMEAIEEFQIAISPFDVTQSGFTGGAINAITRSGTNTFEGSAFYEFRNEDLAGLTPTEDPNRELERLPEFDTWRSGFRFGGPIVKDKAFFFVNGEMLRSTSPQPFNEAYQGNAAGELQDLRQFLIDEVGYDPGTPGDKEAFLDNEKLLAKIDWHLNEDHRLSLRHSYSNSENVDAFRSGAFQINYSNNSEVFPNTTNSTTLELNSSLGNNHANKLILGFTTVTDDRGIAGEPFPTVTIFDGPGEIRLGPEPFSTANLLEQDVFSVTDNFSWFLEDHTLTFGAHLEYYDIANLFIPFNHGWYFFFGGVDAFKEAVRTGDVPGPTGILRGYSLVGDRSKIGDESENIGAFNAYQAGVYVQDKFEASDRLQITAGLRLDVPEITTAPRRAPDVFDTTIPAVLEKHALNGARPGETPDAQIYLQPRLGFTYDIEEDRSTVLRGGAGFFTGRVPFVWPGGMYLNNGANTGIVSRFFDGQFFGEDDFFRPDPSNGVTAEDFGADTPIPSGRLEIFEEDFRYPTVFRTSLGLDHDLGDGFSGTLEGQFTKTLDNLSIKNVNMNPDCRRPIDGPDNRMVYACETSGNQIDAASNQIDSRYTNIHRVGNTSTGYTYDVSAQLQKQFDERLMVSASYTYGDARAVNDGTSDQLNSAWRFPAVVGGGNFLEEARSDFSLGSRILAQVQFTDDFIEGAPTSLNLTYAGESGRPFSYIIRNSERMMGLTDAADAELFYVPEDASDLTFAPITDDDDNVVMTPAEQAAELDEFIDGNEYLSSRRGQYAERNGDRTPFEHVVDLHLEQALTLNFGGRQTQAKIYVDMFNFTNFLNDDWGRRYVGIFTRNVLEFQEYRDPGNGDFTPVYQFQQEEIDSKEDIFDTLIHDFGTYSSRWQLQGGIRFTF